MFDEVPALNKIFRQTFSKEAWELQRKDSYCNTMKSAEQLELSTRSRMENRV